MIPSCPCRVCGEDTHRSSKCPDLAGNLREGFSHENGSTGREIDDGEDDALLIVFELPTAATAAHREKHNTADNDECNDSSV